MISYMGVPNSEKFFSDKDLNSVEFNFILRPSLEFRAECDVAPLHDGIEDQDHKQEVQGPQQEEKESEGSKRELSVSALEIKLPSLGGESGIEDEDEGFRTPTAKDKKIASVLQCPPAPKKIKSLPSTKRKSPSRRLLLDLSNEVESLFPPVLLADLGGKIKKARQGNEMTTKS
ncbi:hypothetical protein K2173_015814 [Erythroxylum novogranatense]|uniref:Cyclin-dependent protein kinase inhibitor SMR3-like n=1 Tax=Erythroxylum novogranatense TaxID=1862640 RepID=A0AAV8SF49_9ROSI|nr:hypothetical protein K2173_015814 [Erythroxylum novogranatense]